MSTLLQYLPMALLILGILAILVLVYLLVLLFRSGSRVDLEDDEELLPPPPEERGDDPTEPDEVEPTRHAISAGAVERSFKRVKRRLRDNVAGPDPRYQLPWFLMLGATGSHDTDMWRHAGLSLPFGPPEEDAMTFEGCNWWLFDGGVVLDPLGDWVLDKGGRRADEKGWGQLLRLLRKHRPKKPIDGVLLAINCRELLQAKRQGAEGIHHLEQRAARMYRKLWQLQKQLDIRFPVYVTILGCQRLPGFHSFCSQLPESVGREIFGWSSPYNVDTAYRSAWVDEVFGTLGGRLQQAQTEIFAVRSDLAESDGIFMFPQALDALREPLQAYLNQIFKSSAYHESILCRGVYFSGTDETPQRTSEAPANTYFLRQLLEQKVFPEAALGRPTANALTTRNRNVRIAQIALLFTSLCLVFGMWNTWRHRDRSRDVFVDVLHTIKADIDDVRSGGIIDRVQARRRTLNLCNGLASIDTNTFRSLLLPASWFSNFDTQLEQAVAQAYEEIVFHSIQDELGDAAWTLTEVDRYVRTHERDRDDTPSQALARLRGGGPQSLDASRCEPMPVNRMEEFLALEDYVQDLAELERIIATYNGLSTSDDRLRDLADVVGYVFETELPPDFFDNSALYEDALDHVDYPAFHDRHRVTNELPEHARSKASRMVQRFQRRLFGQNALARSLDELSLRLQLLSEADRDIIQGQPFRLSLQAIRCVEDVLEHPEIDWAFRADPDLDPRFDDLVASMRENPFLGDDIAAQVRRSSEAAWFGFRRALMESRSELTGPHLKSERGAPLRYLSDDVEVLEAAMQDYLNQSFMNVEDVRRLRNVPSGSRLTWDTLLLEQAVDLQTPYERFRSSGLEAFPIELRTHVERLARNRMSDRILDLIARAQMFDPLPKRITPLLVEPEVQAEIASFQTASEYLLQLLGLFERLNLRTAYQDLARILGDQGARLLGEVDALLEDEKLYTPRGGDFSWWQGDRPPQLDAFNVEDADELEVYLERQRSRLEHLALDYAEPLISSLGKVGIERQAEHRAVFRRWEGIVRELKSYESKSPGNSVAGLEEAIRDRMGEVTLADCNVANTSGTVRGTARNFFVDRRNRLQTSLFERCQILAFEQAAGRYQVAEQFFNRRLADRFPFSNDLPGNFANEADPEDILTFFQDFDSYAGYFQDVPPALANEQTDAAGRFVARMAEVRALLAPFLTSEEDPKVPLFDVDVEFRTNQCKEEGANQIIGWELFLGEDVITHRDEVRLGRWQYGQPVRLALRWARDAQRMPATTDPRLGVWVKGREVSWERQHRWALFGLLLSQQTSKADFCARSEPLPHTLRFQIPTRPADAPEEGYDEDGDSVLVDDTLVFVRLTLLAPETKDPLVLPSDFPVRAPELSGS